MIEVLTNGHSFACLGRTLNAHPVIGQHQMRRDLDQRHVTREAIRIGEIVKRPQPTVRRGKRHATAFAFRDHASSMERSFRVPRPEVRSDNDARRVRGEQSPRR